MAMGGSEALAALHGRNAPAQEAAERRRRSGSARQNKERPLSPPMSPRRSSLRLASKASARSRSPGTRRAPKLMLDRLPSAEGEPELRRSPRIRGASPDADFVFVKKVLDEQESITRPAFTVNLVALAQAGPSPASSLFARCPPRPRARASAEAAATRPGHAAGRGDERGSPAGAGELARGALSAAQARYRAAVPRERAR
jgi:hypothetical protein